MQKALVILSTYDIICISFDLAKNYEKNRTG